MTRFGEPVVPGFRHEFEGTLVHERRSGFQHIEVYDHEHLGRVLLLDGVVQTTERDEFCYHEMLVHPALCALEEVGRVLIIGGGDGGTLRHVLMHEPREVVMCEIDREVVEAAREHMASLSDGAFDDPRTTLVIGDGAAYVADQTDAFDAIVVDSTDPVGAAAVLIGRPFYAACRDALRAGGALVAQTGSPMHQLPEFETAAANMAAAFGACRTYVGFVPTYPGVLWSFTTAGADIASVAPSLVADRLAARGITPRYYTSDLHPAAFRLPAFLSEAHARATSAPVPRG